MAGNYKSFDSALKLRKSGKSYREISILLKIPKSTLSSWFSKEVWSAKLSSRLNIKFRSKNIARLQLMNQVRLKNRDTRNDQYKKEARLEFKKLIKNPLFVAGISIYWGEGEKYGNWRLSVINTDSRMQQVVVKFFRDILHVSRDKIRVGIFAYSDLDPDELLKFWSNTLSVPQSQFIRTHILSANTNPSKRKSIHGICNIYVGSTKLKIKMMEWIRLLSEEYSSVK